MGVKSRLKKQRTEAKVTHFDQGGGFLKGKLILFLALIVAGVGAWVFFEFVVWGNVPSELVGKWVVTEGPDEGGTIDFYRKGKMVAHVNLEGKLGIIEAKIKVEDKKIIATLTNKFTGEEGTRVQTIKILDAKRLVLEDERGNLIKLKRAED